MLNIGLSLGGFGKSHKHIKEAYENEIARIVAYFNANFGVPVVSVTPTTVSITFDRPVTFGAGGNGGFELTASGGEVTLTYSSGSGSRTLVYTTSRSLAAGETLSLAYTQPGDGVEAVANGLDYPTVEELSAGSIGLEGIADLTQWLDASQVVGLADGAAIGTALLDKSGNGRNIVSVAGSPTYRTGVQNSKPGILMTGAGLYNPLSISSGSWTIAFVCRCTGAGNRVINGSNNWLIGPYNDTWQIYAPGFTSTGITRSGNLMIVVYTHTGGGQGKLYMNAVGTVTTVASPGYPGSVNVGVGQFFEPFSGYLFELGAWLRVLTADEITAIFSYLNSKWA